MVQVRWNRLLHWTEDAFAPGWFDLGSRGRRRPYCPIQRGLALGHLLVANVERTAAKTGGVRTFHRGIDVEFDNLYSDQRFWTSAITFVAAWGRKPHWHLE
jgi:hypothetical protein